MISTLIKAKVCASGFPKSVTTQEEKEAWCARWLDEFGIEIDPKDVVFNAALRTTSKVLVNCGWVRFVSFSAPLSMKTLQGKLAERIGQMEKHYFVPEEYQELYVDPKMEIVDAVDIDGDYFYVEARPIKETLHSTRYGALHHAILITARARLRLLSLVEKVS